MLTSDLQKCTHVQMHSPLYAHTLKCTHTPHIYMHMHMHIHACTHTDRQELLKFFI